MTGRKRSKVANGMFLKRLDFYTVRAFHQPTDKPEIDRIIAEVRAQLDEATFESTWAEGRKWSLEQAVADALEEQG